MKAEQRAIFLFVALAFGSWLPPEPARAADELQPQEGDVEVRNFTFQDGGRLPLLRRDRLATGDARQGLPERKHDEQRIVEATAGHRARYVSGVTDECHTSRDEPRWHVLGNRSSEAAVCAQTGLHGAPPGFRPELPRPFLKGFH